MLPGGGQAGLPLKDPLGSAGGKRAARGPANAGPATSDVIHVTGDVTHATLNANLSIKKYGASKSYLGAPGKAKKPYSFLGAL